MQKSLVALAIVLGLSGCDSGIVATDGTNFLNASMGDVVERSDRGAIVVDGQSYLVTGVERTFTDDDRYSQFYGERRTIFYDEGNMRGIPVRCFPGQDCVQLVRVALVRPPQNRVPVDDGEQM